MRRGPPRVSPAAPAGVHELSKGAAPRGRETRFYVVVVVAALVWLAAAMSVYRSQHLRGQSLTAGAQTAPDADDEAGDVVLRGSDVSKSSSSLDDDDDDDATPPETTTTTTKTNATTRGDRAVTASVGAPPTTTNATRPQFSCDHAAFGGGGPDDVPGVHVEDPHPPSGFSSIDAHRRAAALGFKNDGETPTTLSPPSSSSSCPINFTLATQSTPERLWMLKWICERWEGPVVIAIYTNHKSVAPREPACGDRVDYKVISAPRDVFARHTSYPVNKLRNLAASRVKTSHFLLCDVDLWPDAALLRRLRNLASTEAGERFFRNPKNALVVPAFAREVKTECASSSAARDSNAAYRMSECHFEAERMPKTFSELKQCIVRKECHIFDRYNQDGHGTTDYRAWLRQSNADNAVRPIKCFQSNRYEPYVVLANTPLRPRFEEQFTGYGKNKIQNLVHLRYVGWRFAVLPRSFLTHFPHHKSAARMAWEQNSNNNHGENNNFGAARALARGNSNHDPDADEHRTKMDRLYRRFLDTLIDVYGSPGDRTDATLLCHSSSSSSSSSAAASSSQQQQSTHQRRRRPVRRRRRSV